MMQVICVGIISSLFMSFQIDKYFHFHGFFNILGGQDAIFTRSDSPIPIYVREYNFFEVHTTIH